MSEEQQGPLHVLCCDVSGSMWSDADGKSRIARLKDHVARLTAECGEAGQAVKLVCFSDDARVVKSVPDEPGGGTDLACGLEVCAKLLPANTVVISDGEPNNHEAALAAARECPGVINMVYVGPDGNTKAIEFMNKLVRIGAGVGITRRLGRDNSILADLRGLLCLPAPKE